MSVIDKTVIEGFIRETNEEIMMSALSQAEGVLVGALEDISKTNPYVSKNFTLVPVGDFRLGAVIGSSTLDVLVVVSSAEVALNTKMRAKNKWKRFKARLKYAWQNRKKSKKKKRRKKGSEEVTVCYYQNPKENYDISAFAKDLMHGMAKFVTAEDFVRLQGGSVVLEGQTLPFKVRVFPVLEKETGVYEFYSQNRAKLIELDLREYEANLDALIANYGESCLSLARAISGVLEHVSDVKPKGLFVASLLANLPDSAFVLDDYENFVFAINYLLNSEVNELYSIADPKKKIFEDFLCETTLQELATYLRKARIGLK